MKPLLTNLWKSEYGDSHLWLCFDVIRDSVCFLDHFAIQNYPFHAFFKKASHTD